MADLLIREDVTTDEIIDLVEGNRKYVKCLYCYNKIDITTIEEVDRLARLPNSCVISVHAKLNIDELLSQMWEYLGLTRVYTKRRGAPPVWTRVCAILSEPKRCACTLHTYKCCAYGVV